jgi:hypothetical protein
MALASNTLPTLPIEAALLTVLDVGIHGKRAAVPGKLLGLRTSADIESVVRRGELPFRERFLLVTAVSRDGRSIRISDGKNSILATCSERLLQEADVHGTVPFPVSLRDRCVFMNGCVRLSAARDLESTITEPDAWDLAVREHAARLYGQWFRKTMLGGGGTRPWTAFLQQVTIESFIRVEVELVNTQTTAWAFPNRMMTGDVVDVNQSLRVKRKLTQCLIHLLAPIEYRDNVPAYAGSASAKTGVRGADALHELPCSDAVPSNETSGGYPRNACPVEDAGSTTGAVPQAQHAPIPRPLALRMRLAAKQRPVEGSDDPMPQSEAADSCAPINSSKCDGDVRAQAPPLRKNAKIGQSHEPLPDAMATESSGGTDQGSGASAKHAVHIENQIAAMALPKVDLAPTGSTWANVGDAEKSNTEAPESTVGGTSENALLRGKELRVLYNALEAMRLPPSSLSALEDEHARGPVTEIGALGSAPAPISGPVSEQCASTEDDQIAPAVGSQQSQHTALTPGTPTACPTNDAVENAQRNLHSDLVCVTESVESDAVRRGAPPGANTIPSDGDDKNDDAAQACQDHSDGRKPSSDDRIRSQKRMRISHLSCDRRSPEKPQESESVCTSTSRETFQQDNNITNSVSTFEANLMNMSPVPRKRCKAIVPSSATRTPSDGPAHASNERQISPQDRADEATVRDSNGTAAVAIAPPFQDTANGTLPHRQSQRSRQTRNAAVTDGENTSGSLNATALPPKNRRGKKPRRRAPQPIEETGHSSPGQGTRNSTFVGPSKACDSSQQALQRTQLECQLETAGKHSNQHESVPFDCARDQTSDSSTTTMTTQPPPTSPPSFSSTVPPDAQRIAIESPQLADSAASPAGQEHRGRKIRSERRPLPVHAQDRGDGACRNATCPAGDSTIDAHASPLMTGERDRTHPVRGSARAADATACADGPKNAMQASGELHERRDAPSVPSDDLQSLVANGTPRMALLTAGTVQSKRSEEERSMSAAVTPVRSGHASPDTTCAQSALPPWARYLRNLGRWRFFKGQKWRNDPRDPS